MRAALITGKEQIEFKDFELYDQAEPGAVVVDIWLCGICGSDVSTYKTGHPYSPYLSGHEWMGAIHSVGQGVTGLQPGQRVTRGGLPPCGTCDLCRAGHHDRCPYIMSMGSGTNPWVKGHGAYAKRVSVPADLILPLPDAVSDVAGAMVEPATVALHGVRRRSPQLGDTVVITGGGIVGQFAAQLAKIAGAQQVLLIEPIEARRNLARELGGADAVAAPGADAEDWVMSATNGLGADIQYECSGNEAAFLASLKLLRPGGSLMVIGSSFVPYTVPMGAWQGKELSIDFSLAHQHHEFPITLSLLASGRLKADPIHDMTVSLNELPETLGRLASGEDRLKAMVDPRRP